MGCAKAQRERRKRAQRRFLDEIMHGRLVAAAIRAVEDGRGWRWASDQRGKQEEARLLVQQAIATVAGNRQMAGSRPRPVDRVQGKRKFDAIVRIANAKHLLVREAEAVMSGYGA